MAQRYEVFKIDALEKVEKTPEGFLRLPAKVTRTGIFIYRKADGSLVKEFRSPDEVFNADSLSSLLGKPLTNNHPATGRVDSSNAKRHTVGFTSDSVQEDGKFVKVFLNIIDEATIRDIQSGKQELSCGYRCKVDSKSGEFEGERYDSIQRDIKYNHVALVDRGRAGAEVRLNLDSDDAILQESGHVLTQDELSHKDTARQLQVLVSAQLPKNQHVWIRDVFSDHFIYSIGETEGLLRRDYRIRGDTLELVGDPIKVIQKTEFITKEDKKMELESIKINEKEVKVAKADAESLKTHLKSQQEKLDALEKDAKAQADLKNDLENTEVLLDKANGKIKGYKASIAELEKKNDSFDEHVKQAALERSKLQKIAETVLDSEQLEKLDSMDSIAIKKAIISKRSNLKLDEASDAHVDSCFDVICNLKETPKDSLGTAITQGREDTSDKEDARERSMERMKNAYKQNKED